MRFSVLGALEVTDGQRDRTPSAPKLRQVLAHLLVRNNQIIPIHELIDEIWGERPPRSALSTLQTYIYKLRKMFDEAGSAGEDVLLTKHHGYVLDIPPEQLDLYTFEDFAERGRLAVERGDPHQAAEILGRALAIWRGPALVDVTAGELLSAQVTRLEEGRLRALDLRLEADLQLGRHGTLISELKGLTAKHPMHEGFHAKLMLALYRAGRRCEALEVYQRLRRFLVEELGLDPSPALHELQQALLASDPSLDVEPRHPVAAVIPEQGATTSPAQLPPDVAGYVGREEELEQIAGTLSSPADEGTAIRVVAVTGMPGMGKTALAVRAAHRVRSYFPDGQLFMNLEAASGAPAAPFEVLGRLLESCGIPPSRMPDHLDGRSKLFRTWSAGRRLLLVLDDAVSTAQVRPLLPNSSECAVIVTTRSHTLAGAVTVPLDVLHIDEGVRVLADIVGRARVDREPQAAENLVCLCGGVPLALHAVGARLAAVPSWPLSEVAQQLSRTSTRLNHLQLGDLDVRSAYEGLYSMLDARAQAAFPWLGLLHPEGFTAEEAGRLLGKDIDVTESLLFQMLESHLLRITRTGEGGELRYGFQGLSHAYAQELLERASPDSAVTRGGDRTGAAPASVGGRSGSHEATVAGEGTVPARGSTFP